MAIGAAFNTVVAMVVQVSGSSASAFKLQKVWPAADSCLTVNPLDAEAQLIGGVVHAINATLYGEQVFVNGVAQRRNFNNSRMIRPSEMPTVSVTPMPPPAQADRTVAIGGIGELGVPAFAPALAGALLKLGGSPVRRLPLFAKSQMGD